MPKRPVDKLEAVAAFYVQRDVDVSWVLRARSSPDEPYELQSV